jgi:hypothetical protein
VAPIAAELRPNDTDNVAVDLDHVYALDPLIGFALSLIGSSIVV